ncbi:uncharacterized protein LOC143916453 [Arctopsyche grandis]|uniref:uncharacterized protein LOC143916453 n=1 Tax=Arctopsyche grandis TaxID=121162 RepID=UPI00406D83AE
MKQLLRVKQLADQTFSRSGKSEALSDELQAAEKRVENIKTALQILSKKLGQGNSTISQGQDPAAREKRLKKIPEYSLGLSLNELTHFEDSLLKSVLLECGKIEINLANEIADHDIRVEQLVCSPLNSAIDQDLPNISKAKKQFYRLLSEKDSTSNRLNSLRPNDRNPQDKSTQEQQKTAQARDEAEEAELKADQARDALASEMFTLLSKEMQFSNSVLQYLKLQRGYHESALRILKEIIPQVETNINDSKSKPVFGYPIEEHLRVIGQPIAFPLELCVCLLHELGLNEEGLLRIAAGSSRMKRMKLSLDSGIFSLPICQEYKDVHVIGSILKSYLRELPEPLLTHKLYDSFMAAITKNSSEEIRLNALWDVIHKLPKPNFENLRYLIKFLSVLTKNQAVNKMTPSNIAIVMAPNLLWGRDDGSGMGYNMVNATTVNCIVELLVKHADWFYKEDVNFFVSFTKEELICEPDNGKGIYNPSFNQNQDQTNGDSAMSKSMHEYCTSSTNNYQSQTSIKSNMFLSHNKQTHSRSNSHDTSLILVDNEMKRTQSNSSLSDHSSPSQGSPKPVMRRKNKPTAPVPPNFVPQEKKDFLKADVVPQTKDAKPNLIKIDFDKRDKPPRPIISEPIKHMSGVQTIDRSTYTNKHKQLNRAKNKLSSSRESLFDPSLKERRKSIDSELESHAKDEMCQTDISTISSRQLIAAQHGTVAKISIGTETFQHPKNSVCVKSGVTAPKQLIQTVADVSINQTPKPSLITDPKSTTKQDSSTCMEVEPGLVQMRVKPIFDIATSVPVVGVKPAIPERPANIRPASFRNSLQKNHPPEILTDAIELPQNGNTASGDITLERAHVYSVDKQQATFINASNNSLASEVAPLNSDDSNKSGVHRTQNTCTQSTGVTSPTDHQPDQKILTSQTRKLSNSDVDVPPSPRPCHKPPRPGIPAPPPPVSRISTEAIESTDF